MTHASAERNWFVTFQKYVAFDTDSTDIVSISDSSSSVSVAACTSVSDVSEVCTYNVVASVVFLEYKVCF